MPGRDWGSREGAGEAGKVPERPGRGRRGREGAGEAGKGPGRGREGAEKNCERDWRDWVRISSP